MQTIHALLDDYRAHLLSLGCRVEGARTYVDSIRRFAIWLDPKATPNDITRPLILDYIAHETARGCAVKSVHLAMSAIRRFCQWCVSLGHLVADPTAGLKWPRLPQPVPRALSPAHVAELHAVIDAPPVGDLKAVRMWGRNRLAIYLGLYAGLRIGEMAALNWSDIDLDGLVLIVRDGKGGKGRYIPINALLADLLDQVPPEARRGAVLGHKDGRHVDRKSLAHIFERWLPARITFHCSCHSLRHTFAVSLRRAGVDVETIRELLGHADISTTGRYLRGAPELLRSAVDRLTSRKAA